MMSTRLSFPFIGVLVAGVSLGGCAAGADRGPAQQTSMIAPQPSERSEPGETALVAALDAAVLGCEAFGPPSDRRSQPPTNDTFRQAAAEADGDPGKK